MNKTVNIEIAGISTRLILNPDLSDLFKTAYRGFLTENLHEYTLRVNIIDDIPLKKSYNDNTSASMQNNRFVIVSEEFDGYLNMNSKQGVIHISSKWVLESLANFLRNMYSAIIFSSGGMMLHASAVEKENRAYIFFGPSESGKSTIAKASGCTILADELVAVRYINGMFKAHGTPGRIGTNKTKNGINGSCEIAGLFKLVKSRDVYIKKFSYSQAVSEILTIPNYNKSFSYIDKLLDCISDMANVVPCYELHFLPDNSFWRCIDEHIK